MTSPTTRETPARGRPRRHGTRDAATEAAAQLVLKRGYENTSVEDVAREVGVAKTTLYRRWPSKTALMFDALLQHLGGLPALADHSDLPQAVRWLAATTSAPTIRALLTGLIAEAGRDEAIRNDLRDRLRTPFVSALSTGWSVDSDVADMTFDLVLGTMLHISTFRGQVDEATTERITDIAVSYLQSAHP